MLNRLVIATHSAIILRHDDGRAEWLVGVVQMHSYKLDRGIVVRALLADNVHWTARSYLADLASPYVHVVHSWQSPSVDEIVDAFEATLDEGICDRDETLAAMYREGLPMKVHNPEEQFVADLGDPGADLVTDPVWVAEDNDLGLEHTINGTPLHEHDPSFLPALWGEGVVWPVVAAMRHVATLQAHVLHLAVGSGETSRLRLKRARTLLPGEQAAVELDLSAWRSPLAPHAEAPLSEGRGSFKYLVPTGKWWTTMQRMAADGRRISLSLSEVST